MTRVLAAALAFAACAPALALGTGEAIPSADVKLKNVDGREVALADVKGSKGTLVVFTCNECPYVKGWEQRITALGNAAVDKGIGVIAVNANDPGVSSGDTLEAMKKRAQDLGLKFPYAQDRGSALARAFGATRTPEAYLFDAQGKLVYQGTIDDNVKDAGAVKEHYLRDAIDAVAGGKSVPVKETKALGCSIKFARS